MAETLIITGEDQVSNVIKRRLRTCKADLDNVHVVDFRHDDGTPGEITVEVIEKMADSLHGLKLIVIDPIDDLLGVRSERGLGQLRKLFHQLARMAARRGFGVILVNATDKLSTGKIRQYGVDLLPFLEAGTAVLDARERPGQRPIDSSGSVALQPGTCAQTGWRSASTGRLGTFQWDPEPVELKAEKSPAREPSGDQGRPACRRIGYVNTWKMVRATRRVPAGLRSSQGFPEGGSMRE